MIGKITSEMISHRGRCPCWAQLGLVAAPTVLRPSNAEAQTAGATPGRRKVALALQGGGSHGSFNGDNTDGRKHSKDDDSRRNRHHKSRKLRAYTFSGGRPRR